MVRPIDADALISIVETARKKTRTLTGMDFVMVIKDQPTIPAIPVDWIRKYADTVGSRVRAEIVREMLDVWEKEQEGR